MDSRYIFPAILILWLAFKLYKFISSKKKVPRLLKKGATIIDVRTPSEFKSAANPASINIPLNELNTHIHELDKHKPIIVCCASGARSSMAARVLRKNGFKNIFNAGTWSNTLVKDTGRGQNQNTFKS